MTNINFDWKRFRTIDDTELSKAEEVLIEKMFRIFNDGNPPLPDEPEPSSPEMEHRYEIFKASWIMHGMWLE